MPVRDDADGSLHTLTIRSQRQTCHGSRYALNVGRSAISGACAHEALLWVEPSDNNDLLAGHSFHTPATRPLVLDLHRWHGGGGLVASFVLELSYHAP